MIRRDAPAVAGGVSRSAGTTLVVRDLRVTFPGAGGGLPVVRGVSFTVPPGLTLGIVGESGSGKSVTVRAIMGLLPGRAAVAGSARIGGQELIGLREAEMRRHRGSDIAMVFQDPMRSLNPTMRVGAQVAEVVRLHNQMSRRVAEREAVSLLAAVRLSDPERRAREYPHQLSGGMRQRVVIAIALASRPNVLIADEATTALDVTTELEILRLLDDLKSQYGMSVILITHDMGIAVRHTDQIVVMYAGKVVETAVTKELFRAVRMPYTKALINAVPSMDQIPHSFLPTIEGNPPNPARLPNGCSFSPRCPFARDRCYQEGPDLLEGEPRHSWACWYPLGAAS